MGHAKDQQDNSIVQTGENCPTRRILNIIGAKWTLAILPLLRARPMRNNELLRTIDGVSQRVLTETLRHLERHGLVARRDYQTLPRHIEYRLTPLGESLAAAFAGLNTWVEMNYDQIRAATEQHDRL